MSTRNFRREIGDTVFLVNEENGKIVDVNGSVENLLGYRPKEAESMTVMDLDIEVPELEATRLDGY
ncbi:MAG: PAS domain-containing protein [Halobacteria archaeon]